MPGAETAPGTTILSTVVVHPTETETRPTDLGVTREATRETAKMQAIAVELATAEAWGIAAEWVITAESATAEAQAIGAEWVITEEWAIVETTEAELRRGQWTEVRTGEAVAGTA